MVCVSRCGGAWWPRGRCSGDAGAGKGGRRAGRSWAKVAVRRRRCVGLGAADGRGATTRAGRATVGVRVLGYGTCGIASIA